MKYLTNVVSLKLEPEKCNACGRCVEVCPHAVFEIRENKSTIQDRNACMECGACAKNCASEAISVTPGVGCATAILNAVLTGGPIQCGSDSKSSGGCC